MAREQQPRNRGDLAPEKPEDTIPYTPPPISPPPQHPTPPGEPEPTRVASESPHPQSEGDNLTTGFIPSFRPAGPEERTEPGAPAEVGFLPGQMLGDFQILGVLGRGAFATVYLARQVSLGRQVALKVSPVRETSPTPSAGSEARTLASMEHAHIVQVYSETVDPARRLRLLCMQFVPGTTLERVIAHLGKMPRDTWTGERLLEVIDSLCVHPALFDPASVREREYLGRCGFVEAVCWLGARLAEGLAQAHMQGVLHRDIKPSNILINRYGRPLLADFNVSLDPERRAGPAGEVFGGTLEYMAPEHLDAFNPDSGVGPDAVDERSDIYSFGVVLYELLTGKHPFGKRPRSGAPTGDLGEMAQHRRAWKVVGRNPFHSDGSGPSEQAPSHAPALEDEGTLLTLQRCLAPDPADRFQSAAELCQALEDNRERQRIAQDLPPAGVLTRAAMRHPLWMLTLLLLLPHFIGSLVNITYNHVRIVQTLTPLQQAVWMKAVFWYNILVYPACLAILAWLLVPPARLLARLSRHEMVDREEVRRVRRHVLAIPQWVIVVSCAGWLPGGVVFPLSIHLLGGGVSADVFWHFLVSFTLSGLIALTYSVFGTQTVVLRVLYPRLLLLTQGLRQTTATELATLPARLRPMPFLAGLIPLLGAVMMIVVAPEQLRDQYQTFRVLVTALIALGMLGFGVALGATRFLEQTLTALLGSPHRSPASRPPARRTIDEKASGE